MAELSPTNRGSTAAVARGQAGQKPAHQAGMPAMGVWNHEPSCREESRREQRRALQQVELAGTHENLQPAVHLELAHDIRDVPLDRSHRHHQLLRYRRA